MSFVRGKLYFSDDSHPQTLDVREAAVKELSALGIAGATIYQTQGIWNGAVEYGFVLETMSDCGVGNFAGKSHIRTQLEELAEMLRSEFNQTSVLVTIEIVDGTLVFVEETNK